MNCQEVEALLSQASLSELQPNQQEDVAEHLAGCAACRERWDSSFQSGELRGVLRMAQERSPVRDAVMGRIGGGKPPEAKAKKRLGGFELLGRLGKGGMGTVLKARQVSMDRVVALKILPKRLAVNEDYVKRFVREARAAARLRHPHIVQAYDVGKAEGTYYFAMEYVDGETCSDVLRRDGPLPPGQAVAILKQTASALAAAHEAGIVHRDIKPSNLMLDRKGDVRVTDFGLAKRTEGDIAVTADGCAMGTPSYVAPEMAKGQQVDGRADLYSLGATAFHLLAGRPPFEGENHSVVLIKQVNERAPALAEIAPHVDRRLCGIVDRLLRKNPAARFDSAEALLEALDGLGELENASPSPQAEARAALREAPTLPLSGGQRTRQRIEAEEERRRKRPALRRFAVPGSVALVLLLVIWLVVRPGGEPPRQARKGDEGEKTKTLFGDLREEQAKALYQRAQGDAGQSKWLPALESLSALETDYASTAFSKSNRTAIATLKAKAQEALRGSTTVKTSPPPPRPLPPPPKKVEWQELFDGATLGGWRRGLGGVFGTDGEVKAEDGELLLVGGKTFTGIAWEREFPRVEYEVSFEAKRLAANDAVCTLLAPVGEEYCLFGLGAVSGISFLNGREANWNPSRAFLGRDVGRWVAVRFRVTERRIAAWVDGAPLFDMPRRAYVPNLPGGHDSLVPLGLYVPARARSVLRNIRFCHLAPEHAEPEAAENKVLQAAMVAVDARCRWADTGLDLEQGREYRFQAAGRWGTRFTITHGPGGNSYAHAGQSWPLPGGPQFCLVGRVGEDGTPFRVGSRTVVTAERAGRLYLTKNDYEFGPNWGTLKVTVGGPLRATLSAHLLSRFARELGHVEVLANGTIAATDIVVHPGRPVLVEAQGKWSIGETTCDADGVNKVVDRLRLGALHASIGERGGPYMIGAFRILDPLTSGPLRFAIHDPEPKDNSGSVTVTVRAFQPPVVEF